jgi:hypothetical protein
MTELAQSCVYHFKATKYDNCKCISSAPIFEKYVEMVCKILEKSRTCPFRLKQEWIML